MPEELSILPDGEDYVLRRDLGNGSGYEIILSPLNVVTLSRLAPDVARRILSSKSLADGRVLTSVPASGRKYLVKADVHNDALLLRI